MGQETATVRVTYTDIGGHPYVLPTRTLPPLGAATFFMPDFTDVPNGYGSALVESLTGQPIVAIVNAVSRERGIDVNYRAGY